MNGFDYRCEIRNEHTLSRVNNIALGTLTLFQRSHILVSDSSLTPTLLDTLHTCVFDAQSEMSYIFLNFFHLDTW